MLKHFYIDTLVGHRSYNDGGLSRFIVCHLMLCTTAFDKSPIFKPGVRQPHACAWFLEIVFVRTSVCVCVCLPPRLLKTIHVK